LQWVGHAPQAFPSKVCKTVWYSMQMNVNVWVQHLNAVRAPLKHSEYLQRMNGDQLALCAVARSNQNNKSLLELQWVGLAPSDSL